MDFKRYDDGFFAVNGKNGFLPQREPMIVLPSKYVELQTIIDAMPIVKDNNEPGLLSKEGAFEKAIDNLPNLLEKVKEETDPYLLQALFRAYAFFTSAYTLAPAHFQFLKNGKYGKAYNYLPPQIAQPFVAVSQKLEVFPWIDYHYAYSLGNYKKIDGDAGMNWDNLGMCAKFSGMPDERGFIMLHVDMNQYSPDLIEGISMVLSSEKEVIINEGLHKVLYAISEINERRRLMWTASRWRHYNDFRVFIMGIEGNEDIFGPGLVYGGVSEAYQKYRGQTGAQDNIIPTLDIFTGVIQFYPQNELTAYLMDLRQYRPKVIQYFLEDLRKELGKNPLIDRLNKSQNTEGIITLLKILEEVYAFRNGHWQFVQKYIMANTVYPKATGGTPIISWIPNQLNAVLSKMKSTFEQLPERTPDFDQTTWQEKFKNKAELLNQQLQAMNSEGVNPNKIFALNEQYGLKDSQ